MPSLPIEPSRRPGRWLWPAALLAVTPKCLLCGLAYAGLGTALGLGGPEICGAVTGPPSAWVSLLAWLGAAGGLAALVLQRKAGSARTAAVARQPTGAAGAGALPHPR